MEATEETFGPIVGTEVRWWSESGYDNYPRLAAYASNSYYPKEDPWDIEFGTVVTRSGSSSYKHMVKFSQGTVVGATEQYAVISVNNRLIPLHWEYLWIQE